jgi:hypothetical protein
MEVHLVADTNLFFECKVLEELPWSELGFDSIVILLTKPVLEEIDKHKKANGRTRKRALEIFKRVREMLATSTTDLVVRDASPRVVLRRIPNVAPDEAHRGALDYSKNDDRLIGILATLNENPSGHKVMLFTDDTGPAATANGLGLPFAMINEEWRRPAEETTEDKQIRELQKDLATYRSQEPKISIGPCEWADDSGVVTVMRKIAQPLAEPEIAELLGALQLKHPMKMDFSLSATARSDQSQTKSAIEIRFEPPDKEDIKKYQDVLYPQWLNRCRTILSELHVGMDEIEGPIILKWAISNEGTRPALQVRVQFEAQGPLTIRRLLDSADEEDADEGPSAISDPPPVKSFPTPPKPPAFKKVIVQLAAPSNEESAQLRNLSILAAGVGHLPDHLSSVSPMAKLLASGNFDSSISALKGFEQLGGASLWDQHRRILETPGLSSIIGQASYPEIASFPIHRPLVYKHDPEAFYYDWPLKKYVKKGALTCDLWRHQDSEEVFEFGVDFTEEGAVRGSILCTVHAENLTKPETSRISICRKVEVFRLLELARTMVENCV